MLISIAVFPLTPNTSPVFLLLIQTVFLLPLNDSPLTNSKNVGLSIILLTSFCAEKPKLLRANHLYLAM